MVFYCYQCKHCKKSKTLIFIISYQSGKNLFRLRFHMKMAFMHKWFMIHEFSSIDLGSPWFSANLILQTSHLKDCGLGWSMSPRPNFIAANLREIKNPEDWQNKIQNFKLKIFLKKKFENLVCGHQSIFLIIDFFEP